MNGLMRQHRNNINLMVALIVFLNAIAPLSVVAKEFSGSDYTSFDKLYGEKIVICTPGGFKYVSIDELNAGAKNGGDEGQNHCPLCLIKITANFLVTVDLSTHFLVEFSDDVHQFYATELSYSKTNLYSTIQSRAPPFLL